MTRNLKYKMYGYVDTLNVLIQRRSYGDSLSSRSTAEVRLRLGLEARVINFAHSRLVRSRMTGAGVVALYVHAVLFLNGRHSMALRDSIRGVRVHLNSYQARTRNFSPVPDPYLARRLRRLLPVPVHSR
jgi:hypothetical protein